MTLKKSVEGLSMRKMLVEIGKNFRGRFTYKLSGLWKIVCHHRYAALWLVFLASSSLIVRMQVSNETSDAFCNVKLSGRKSDTSARSIKFKFLVDLLNYKISSRPSQIPYSTHGLLFSFKGWKIFIKWDKAMDAGWAGICTTYHLVLKRWTL